MLILARRPGERVVIGDEILVTVMEVSASTVRLGIEAPRGVSIFREEIWLAVKEENKAAAEAQADALPSTPIEEALGEAVAAGGEAPPKEEDSPQADALPQAEALPHGEVSETSTQGEISPRPRDSPQGGDSPPG